MPPPAPPRASRCGGATSSKSPAARAQEEVASCGAWKRSRPAGKDVFARGSEVAPRSRAMSDALKARGCLDEVIPSRAQKVPGCPGGSSQARCSAPAVWRRSNGAGRHSNGPACRPSSREGTSSMTCDEKAYCIGATEKWLGARRGRPRCRVRLLYVARRRVQARRPPRRVGLNSASRAPLRRGLFRSPSPNCTLDTL